MNNQFVLADQFQKLGLNPTINHNPFTYIFYF